VAALTADQIVDRVRSVCAGFPFEFGEGVVWDDFDKQPSTNIDKVFRIPPPSSQSVLGGFAFAEERTDTLQIWVARKHRGDHDAVRRVMLRDVHSLTAAVVRDALEDSGDYVVPDEGRGHTIQAESRLEYVTLRLTLPVSYEAQL
jgi:hypothetical protein